MSKKHSTELAAIDLSALDAVSGGAGDAPNTTKAEGNIGVKWADKNVGITGSYESKSTNYKACLDRFKNEKLSDVVAACGKPPQ